MSSLTSFTRDHKSRWKFLPLRNPKKKCQSNDGSGLTASTAVNDHQHERTKGRAEEEETTRHSTLQYEPRHAHRDALRLIATEWDGSPLEPVAAPVSAFRYYGPVSSAPKADLLFARNEPSSSSLSLRSGASIQTFDACSSAQTFCPWSSTTTSENDNSGIDISCSSVSFDQHSSSLSGSGSSREAGSSGDTLSIHTPRRPLPTRIHQLRGNLPKPYHSSGPISAVPFAGPPQPRYFSHARSSGERAGSRYRQQGTRIAGRATAESFTAEMLGLALAEADEKQLQQRRRGFSTSSTAPLGRTASGRSARARPCSLLRIREDSTDGGEPCPSICEQGDGLEGSDSCLSADERIVETDPGPCDGAFGSEGADTGWSVKAADKAVDELETSGETAEQRKEDDEEEREDEEEEEQEECEVEEGSDAEHSASSSSASSVSGTYSMQNFPSRGFSTASTMATETSETGVDCADDDRDGP